MKKVFLSKDNGIENHAGTKARNDAEYILEECGYRRISTSKNYKFLLFQKLMNYVGYNLKLNFSKNTIVFNQYPDFSYAFYQILVRKKRKKNFKIVTLIHDLALRAEGTKVNNDELQRLVLNNSDILIVHNHSMRQYLRKYGIPKEKMIPLEIFDYLTMGVKVSSECPSETDRNQIIIAGNLDMEKCAYIRQLPSVVGTVKFNLYGSNYSKLEENADKVDYKGSFTPEKLLNVMEGGWGLVWDGYSLDTCAGSMGQYLKVNNPHKTSLYLAAKKPVIIWKEAALAEFVKKRGIGILIDNLNEISNKIALISNEQYEKIYGNIYDENKKITTGYYLKQAIYRAEEKLML